MCKLYQNTYCCDDCSCKENTIEKCPNIIFCRAILAFDNMNQRLLIMCKTFIEGNPLCRIPMNYIEHEPVINMGVPINYIQHKTKVNMGVLWY